MNILQIYVERLFDVWHMNSEHKRQSFNTLFHDRAYLSMCQVVFVIIVQVKISVQQLLLEFGSVPHTLRWDRLSNVNFVTSM